MLAASRLQLAHTHRNPLSHVPQYFGHGDLSSAQSQREILNYFDQWPLQFNSKFKVPAWPPDYGAGMFLCSGNGLKTELNL